MTERRERAVLDEPIANRHEVRCDVCGAMFSVSDGEYETIRRSLDFDPTDSAFICEECEADRADDERR